MKSYKSNINIRAQNKANKSFRDACIAIIEGSDNGKLYGLIVPGVPSVTPKDTSIKLSKLLSIELAAKEVIDRSDRLYSGEVGVDVYGAIKNLKKVIES